MEYLHKDITDLIIKAYYQVYNTLGYGFLEKVYERALILEMQEYGLECKSQYPISVYYLDEKVGDYFADIVVDDSVIVEVKATAEIRPEHEVQLVNYLKATEMEVGLLLNFGKDPKFKRKLFTNDRKK